MTLAKVSQLEARSLQLDVVSFNTASAAALRHKMLNEARDVTTYE